MSLVSIGGQMAGISINASGAIVNGKPLEHTLEEAMRQLATAEKACRFAIGDLILATNDLYGEKYARWSELTGWEIQSLQDIASTCKRVPIERRIPDKLSFSHHRVVAALTAKDQEEWLKTAADLGMNRARLEKSVQLGRVATAEDLKPKTPEIDPADTGYENVHPHVNRLSAYLSRKERNGEYEDMDVRQLYRFHLDVMPVVTRWRKVIQHIERAGDPDAMELVRTDLQNINLSLN